MISLEDFRIQSKNEDGSFGKTTGYVKLHSGTKLTVYGDFYTESTSYNYFGYGNSSNPAIFELHGNFKQIGTDTYYFHDNIANIKTVFAGDSEQHISFDKLDSSADLGRIEVLNAGQTIYLDTPMYRLYPLNSITIIGDVNVNMLQGTGTNSHTIIGNLDVNASLSMADNYEVTGNVYVQSGCLDISNDRELIANGDLRIQSENEDGTFSVSTGYVKLHSGTKLTVYGDFYTESTSYNYFGYGNSSNPAIFELHGNFKQIGTDTYYFHDNIANIKTVFAGDSEQHISFDKLDSSADLGRIEVLNAGQTIYLDTPMYRLYPLNSITIIGDVNVNMLQGTGTNSHTIIGNLDVNASLSMADNYEVTGNVYVQSGCLDISNDRELIVNGDLRIQSENEDETFGVSTGYVKLHSGTKLTVYGDFYTESTAYEYFGYGNSSNPAIFELHGNFKQIGTDTYYFHDNIANIKTVFAGDSEQHISFDKLDSSADLGRIEVLNAGQTIYLDTPMYRLYPLNDFNIIGDVEVQYLSGSENYLNINGSLLAKYPITINHNLNIKKDAVIDAAVYLNKSMNIEGNLRVQKLFADGSYSNTSGFMSVKGGAYLSISVNTYFQTTATNYFGDGSSSNPAIIELKGGLYQYGANNNFKNYESGTVMIFSGTNAQPVRFDNYAQSALGTIMKINSPDLIFQSRIYSFSAASDIAISGMIDIYNINFNGFSIHFKSNATLAKGNLMGGYLRCNGSLDITENVNLNYGRLDCNGALLVNGTLFVTFARAFIKGSATVNGTMKVKSGGIICERLLTVNGSFDVDASEVYVKDNVIADGKIYISNKGFFSCDGNLTINGIVTSSSGYILVSNNVIVETDGKLHVFGVVNSHGLLSCDGRFTVDGFVNISKGEVYVKSNITILSSGEFVNKGFINCDGQFTVYGSAKLDAGTAYISHNTVVYGTLDIKDGGLLNSIEDVSVHGKISLFAGNVFTNGNVLINNYGTLYIGSRGLLNCDGNLTVYGLVDMGSGNLYSNGSVMVESSGTVNLYASVLVCFDMFTLNGNLKNTNASVFVRDNFTINENGNLEMIYYSSLLQVRGDFINNKKGGLNLEFGILDLKRNLHNNTGIYTGTGMNTQFSNTTDGLQDIYTESTATVKFENLSINLQGIDKFDVLVHTKDGDYYWIRDAVKALGEECHNFNCTGDSCSDCQEKKRKKIWTNLYWSTTPFRFPDALENEFEIPEMPEMPEMPEIPTVEDLKTRYFGFNGVYSPTGNYSTSFTDMTVPTILGDLTFTRTYNSLDYKISNVGKGFTFSYDMKMEFLKDTISIIMPNGSRSNFKLENGEYTALDSRGILYSEDDGYILETLDQMRYGFDFSGHIKYAEDCKGNRITIITDANDGRILSISDPTGVSVSFEYLDGKLTEIKDNKSGRTVTYHYNGDLMDYSYDASCMQTTYSYTQDGFLEEVWDNTGRRLLYLTYDNTVPFGGKIHEVTDVTGNQFTYTYDEINMQTTITDRNGRSTVQGYGYDLAVSWTRNELGLTERVTYSQVDGQNKYNEVESSTDIYGNTTTYERDSRGNVIKITYSDGSVEQFGFDSLNNMISHTDRNNDTTWYVYDGYYLQKEVQPLDGVSAYSEAADQDNYAIMEYIYDPNAVKKGAVQKIYNQLNDAYNYTAYEYNEIGEIACETRYIDGTAYNTQYFYDNVHRLTKQVDPDGTVTEYVYNLAGQIVRTTVTNGSVVSVNRTVYDDLGRKVQEIGPVQYRSEYDYIAPETVTGGSYSDANAGTTYHYNNEGFVDWQRDALGAYTHFEYDDYGNTIKQTLANGSYSRFGYDVMNRKTFESFYDHTNHMENVLEEIRYGIEGRNTVIETTTYLDAGLSSTSVEKYNFESNLVEEIGANGARYIYTYAPGGRLMSESHAGISKISYQYYPFGNVKSQISRFDNTGNSETYFEYDKAGNVIEQRVKNNGVGQAESYAVTRFEYDNWGRQTKVCSYDNDQLVSEASVEYDWADRIIKQIKGENGSSVVGFEYDHMGNIVKKTDALGNVETYTFDNAGRVISSTDRNGTVHSIKYDVMGNPLVKTNTDGSQTITKTYTYDCMGNLNTVDDGNEVMHYDYDGSGNKTREYGGNTAKFFNYNIGGLLTETEVYFGRTLHKNTLYTYNESGQVVKVSEGYRDSTVLDTVSEFQYDVLGRRTLVVNANGTSEKTEYNAAGLITRLTNYSGPNVISKYEYTYYYDGNQRTKTDESGKTSYVYDDLGRLTEAQLADGTLQNYTFDSNGNRKTMTVTKGGESSVTEYAYDLNDRLITETKDGVTTSYSYDNNGNMLGKSDGTSVVTQTFDLLNRMTTYTDGETTASYTYNPDNMRRSKTVNGVKTEHVWVGSDIALDITGSSVVSYMQGIKSNYGWYVYNAHGDVVQLCDNNGVVTKSYDYDPYGNQLTEADALDKNPYRYSGEYYDAESGYIYLRARYYDSATGRFISEDPAFDGFNWYAYCGGNPLNRWDPSGQTWYEWALGISAVAVGTIMCATGFGAPVGIGLITGGASSLTASVLGAAGFDSQLVSIVNASVDVVVGDALLLTPFAPVGAGMIGSGLGALIGGAISENLGGSYEFGANIGSIVGGVVGSVGYDKFFGPHCFIAGTLIETEEGQKPIEEIQAGDMVLAENPETGEIALKRVVQTFENESYELVHVFVNGEEIITTPSHPFYVPKLGWTSAIKLRAGDILVLFNGEYVVVEAVQHEILESPVKVYNFEVEDFHTYFVGENGVFVHNRCGTEGDFGTYDDLLKQGHKGDNITPHHAPSAEYMKRKGVSRGESAAFNMEQPKTGGRHRKTKTYGHNMTNAEKAYYYSLSPRDALAYDLWDMRNIYIQEGLYDQMRPKLIAYSKYVQDLFPELFTKK